MVTSNELATAAGITVPEWVDLTTDFDAQVKYLFPVLRAQFCSASVAWTATPNGWFYGVHICEREHLLDPIVRSFYLSRSADDAAEVVAEAIAQFWGLTDADE